MLGPTSLPATPLVTMPGPDLMGKEAARGTCHKCGGSLSRGNSDLAKQCGACGTRFHMSDCGGRLAAAGNHEELFDQCPKVRQPEPMLSDLANAPPDPPARPRHISAPALLLGSEISTVFLAGEGGHSRRGCCARSVIPGSVHGAHGVDGASGFLARVSPPRSQVGAPP